MKAVAAGWGTIFSIARFDRQYLHHEIRPKRGRKFGSQTWSPDREYLYGEVLAEDGRKLGNRV